DIGDYEGDLLGAGDEREDRLDAVGAADDAISVFLQNGGANLADGRVVVHKEDKLAVSLRYLEGRGAGGLGCLAFNGGQENAESGAAAYLCVQFDEAVV